MNIQSFYDLSICEEEGSSSSLNCFAFRRGYDVKANLPLSDGNMRNISTYNII